MHEPASMGRIADGVHRFALRVYYEDTDAGGIVYYANYLKFAERARTEMLRCFGLPPERLAREAGVGLVVRRAAVDFLAPARLDDALVVTTRLVAYGGATLDLAQEVWRDRDALVRLDIRIACLGVGGRPTRLPPALVAAIASFSPKESTMVDAHAR